MGSKASSFSNGLFSRCRSAALATFAACVTLAGPSASAQTQPRVLVFSGINPTSTYVHDAIQYGITLLKTLAPKAGFAYDLTTRSADFNDENLKKYQAVFFNNSCRSSTILNAAERAALEKFIRAGGGWIGNHCSAGMTVGAWPWYERLVGGMHSQHTPGSVSGVLKVENRTHVSMKHFKSDTWNIAKEELYYFRNSPTPSWRPNPTLPKVNVLLTFQSWGNGNTRPDGNKGDSVHMGGLAWYHEFEGGRSWYTGLGHEQDLYTKDSLYIKHLMGGFQYVLRMDEPTAILPRSASAKPNARRCKSRVWAAIARRRPP
jgi:cytochrome c